MTEAVAYMRCSGDSQVTGDTWDRQMEKIRALADAHEMTIVKEWREEGISGKVDCEQRPAFQEMLAELLSNGCRTIIVEDLSRLARRYAVQEQILFYLAAKGITLWCCANGGEDITAAIQADPTKRLLIGIVGLVSQWEREQIEAKLRAARRRIKEQGRSPGAKNFSADPARNHHAEGRIPYGWKPGEAVTLQRMIALAGGGERTRAIAATLNGEGLLARSGKPWNHGSVAKILSRQ